MGLQNTHWSCVKAGAFKSKLDKFLALKGSKQYQNKIMQMKQASNKCIIIIIFLRENNYNAAGKL